MPLNPLNHHYSMENPASVYDEEAMTALELAARTTAKVNETVAAFNGLEQETREHLEDQDATIDQRMDAQDARITKMNDVTMPQRVAQEIDRVIAAGEFAEDIDRYAGELTRRVNNLVGSVTEGSTSMDAEVIDGRLSVQDVVYPTMGEAVRRQFDLTQDAMYIKTPITLEVHTGQVYNMKTNAASENKTCQYARYDFNGEKIVCVTGHDFYSDTNAFFAMFDAEGNCIFNGFKAQYTNRYSQVYAVPSNAAYMVINGKNNRPNVEAYSCEVAPFDDAVRATPSLRASQMVGYAEDGETVTVRLALTPENTEKLYARCYAYDGYFTDWTGKETIYSTLYLPIDPSWISVNLREYNIGESGGAFVNKNKTMIDDFATNYPHHLEEKVIPEGAHYIAITCKDADPYHNIYITMRRHRLLGQHDTGSVWRDKKVVWIGTSIPWGQGSEKSYALELSRHLGFDLVPAFAPGLAIHLQNHNVLQYGSLSASKTEYANQGITIPDEPPVWSPGTGNSYYYRTWSNVFNSANADADLFVFDVLPNNNNWSLHNWEAFDHENWRYKDDSLFASHRDTFLGAMLHLMDKMYACNPKARMVLMITSHLSMAGWENLRLLSEQYNIPIINVWERVNTTPAAKAQLIQTDGVHLTTYAHELIGRMLVGEFLRIA